jgi:hypothetical protein
MRDTHWPQPEGQVSQRGVQQEPLQEIGAVKRVVAKSSLESDSEE